MRGADRPRRIHRQPYAQDPPARQTGQGGLHLRLVQGKPHRRAIPPQPVEMQRPQRDAAVRLAAHGFKDGQPLGDRSRNAALHSASSHSDPARLSWVMPPPTFSRSRSGATMTGDRIATENRIGPAGSAQPMAPQ